MSEKFNTEEFNFNSSMPIGLADMLKDEENPYTSILQDHRENDMTLIELFNSGVAREVRKLGNYGDIDGPRAKEITDTVWKELIASGELGLDINSKPEPMNLQPPNIKIGGPEHGGTGLE